MRYIPPEEIEARERAAAKRKWTTHISEDCACDILTKLSKDKELNLAIIAARKLPDKCACDILMPLSKEEEWAVRACVAGNEDIPIECICEILERLSKDKDKSTRKNVASRIGDIPEECACGILNRLSLDDDKFVRRAVAKRDDIPLGCAIEILERLSKDDEYIDTVHQTWGIAKKGLEKYKRRAEKEKLD